MSNVLIGIIGVILFIGLALAGALILGDDFRNASSSSKAAAIMNGVGQISDAANMYRLKMGAPLRSGDIMQLAPRFIRARPTNVVGDGWNYDMRDSGGFMNGDAYVAETGMPLTPAMRQVCIEIAQDNGMPLASDGGPIQSSTLPSQQTGCFQATGWGDVSNMYLVYKRI
jgi:hypothetical protein